MLLIDLDPQANLSLHYGVDIHSRGLSIYQIIIGTNKPDEVVRKTQIDGLDLIPSNIDLASAEIELVNTVGRETVIKFNLENFYTNTIMC